MTPCQSGDNAVDVDVDVDVEGVTGGRPQSLVEVVVAAKADPANGIDPYLREFLDAFYSSDAASTRATMLAPEPPLQDTPIVNAYLAAVAEHLARRDHLPIPEWVHEKSRFLSRAFFPCKLESLKAMLLMESPSAFRRRMIFVGADPLYRPRRDVPVLGQGVLR